MNTFREYVGWVRETQPLLDLAWERAVAEGPEHPRGFYGDILDEVLKGLDWIHPQNDNHLFCLGTNIEDSLSLLKEGGCRVTDYKENKNVVSMWRGGGGESEYYRLLHSTGLGSIQLFNDAGDVIFYFGSDDELVQRFTSPKEAEYLAKIPKDRAPDMSFRFETRVCLNPYGKEWEGGTQRDKDRTMEETVLQIMDRIIEQGVPALFQNYVGYNCIINPPQ